MVTHQNKVKNTAFAVAVRERVKPLGLKGFIRAAIELRDGKTTEISIKLSFAVHRAIMEMNKKITKPHQVNLYHYPHGMHAGIHISVYTLRAFGLTH